MESNEKLIKLNSLIKKLGILIDLKEFKEIINRKRPVEVLQSDNVFESSGKNIKNWFNSFSYDDANAKFDVKLKRYNSEYEAKIKSHISVKQIETLIDDVKTEIYNITDEMFKEDKYGLGKLEFSLMIAMDPKIDIECKELLYHNLSNVLNERYDYISNIKKNLLSTYQSISEKYVDINKIRLTAGLLTGCAILFAINPLIGGITASASTTTAALAGLFGGVGMAEGVLLLCGISASVYALSDIGITEAQKLIQRNKLKEEFYKLTVEETTLSLAKTIMSLVQIKKYIDNDDNARKLYYELIERYVDIKSDIELKMLMNIDAETNFQKTKVFNKVDEFLFTKFKKA